MTPTPANSPQHPRRDSLLARLLTTAVRVGDGAAIRRLLPAAQWSPGAEVEPVLCTLCAHPDDGLRRDSVQAIGWRLAHRLRDRPQAAATMLASLTQALVHRDATTQLFAAEALAQAGRADGLNVLMAAVETLTDDTLRRRAVLALGQTGDARAVPTLLRLATTDSDPLQPSAAEALGHMGRTNKAAEIVALLSRLANATGPLASHALRGLRWLDHPQGWLILQSRARDEAANPAIRAVAVAMLGFRDEPAVRDGLLRLLAGCRVPTIVAEALRSARRLWPEDSLEPDYALLLNAKASTSDRLIAAAHQRVGQIGEADRLLKLMPLMAPPTQLAVSVALLHRAQCPPTAAVKALAANDPTTVWTAARLLAFAHNQPDANVPPAEICEPALTAAITHWRGVSDRLARPRASPTPRSAASQGERATVLAALQTLVWASARWGLAPTALCDMMAAPPDGDDSAPLRRQLLMAAIALADSDKPSQLSQSLLPTLRSTLTALAQGGPPADRSLAAEAAAQLVWGAAPDEFPSLLTGLVDQPASLPRVVMATGVVGSALNLEAAKLAQPVLCQALNSVHHHGGVLPLMVATGQLDTLRDTAANPTLAETVRLGAMEGLALLATPAASTTLASLAQSLPENSPLRRAAWRLRRRCLRRVAKARAAAVAAGQQT